MLARTVTPESINASPANVSEDMRLEWNSVRGTGCGLVGNNQQSKGKKKSDKSGDICPVVWNARSITDWNGSPFLEE